MQVFRERNAPVSHSPPSPVSHSGGKSNHTPRNRAGPLLPKWLTQSSAGLGRERVDAVQGAGTKATVNHQVGISPSVFQGQGEPAVHKSPMYSPGFPGGAASKEPAVHKSPMYSPGFPGGTASKEPAQEPNVLTRLPGWRCQ